LIDVVVLTQAINVRSWASQVRSIAIWLTSGWGNAVLTATHRGSVGVTHCEHPDLPVSLLSPRLPRTEHVFSVSNQFK